MKGKGFLILSLILLTIFVLTILDNFRPHPPGPQTDTVYVYDTTTVQIEVEKPVPYAVYTHDTIIDTLYIHDTIPADTASILADYFLTKTYRDTIQDTDLAFFLTETVYANRITSRETSYKILRPQTITHKTYYTNYVHGGVSVYYTSKGAGFAINGLYTTPEYMFGLGVDPLNKGLFFHAGIKIIEL